MHWMFSFPVRPFSNVIPRAIKLLFDIPGVGIVDTLPHKPFYPGCYVLSTTIRRDIRPPSDSTCSPGSTHVFAGAKGLGISIYSLF